MSLLKIFLITLSLAISGVLADIRPSSDPVSIASNEASNFIPLSTPLIHRESSLLSYDGKTRNAHWVYQKLTADSLEGDVDRGSFDFMEDPLVPSMYGATKNDFKDSDFDRGHLCPAADAKASPDAMKDTFYLSNISPQYPHLNRKLWLSLETRARNLTKHYEYVEVISGPLYLPEQGDDGKRYVKFQVIGQNDVAVPTHFFKVIHARKAELEKIEAYIVPNKKIYWETSLAEFRVDLEKVEKTAGIVFGHK